MYKSLLTGETGLKWAKIAVAEQETISFREWQGCYKRLRK